MGLDLNTEQEYTRIDGSEIPFFKEFYGRNVEKASEIRQAGRVIAPVHLIMERKTNSPMPDWNLNYFDSGDGFAYPAEGTYQNRRFKVVLNSQELTDMEKGSELIDGGLTIPSYEQAKGKEFNEGDAIFNRDLKENQVPDHPTWLDLFRGNRELLGQVAQRIFKTGKDIYGYEDMMGIYLAEEQVKPNIRAVYVDWPDDGSRLFGGGNLGYRDGRLVGVAPEALMRPGKK